MKNLKVYKELSEQEIHFMLSSFNVKSKWIEMYTDYVHSQNKSIASIAQEYGYSTCTARNILHQCTCNMETYIDTCGYKYVPTVDDDILMLHLPNFAYNALKRYGVPSIEVLRLMNNEQLMAIRGLGVSGVNAINTYLTNLGFETNSEKYEVEE